VICVRLMKSTLRPRLPLLLIVLVGTALRLFRLGADSLWYDETVSTFLAGSPLFNIQGEVLGLNFIDSEGRVSSVPVSKIKSFIGM